VWYRCLVRAGLVPESATSGMHMHRGRHTAATELQRAHHDLRLTQLLLGQADIRSTARYAQLDTADLAQALRQMQKDADKCSHPKSLFAGEVEAAGIEPASAAAPARASTSLSCDSGSPAGRLAGGLPTG
jgi:hypothetical protein